MITIIENVKENGCWDITLHVSNIYKEEYRNYCLWNNIIHITAYLPTAAKKVYCKEG